MEFNAKNMRQIAYEAEHRQETEEYEQVKHKIEIAAKSGMYSIIVAFNYRKTKERLENLGFHFEKATRYNMTNAGLNFPEYWIIEWR